MNSSENQTANPVVVCSLYRFTPLDDVDALRRRLLRVMHEAAVCGTVLLAAEGVNATIAGDRGGVDAVLAWLRRQPGLEGVGVRESYAAVAPFQRTKVKVKEEIVTMGVADVDTKRGGVRVSAADWNALLDDEEVLVVDARNEYEIAIGGFVGAVNPHTENFREFPAFADEHLRDDKQRPIAMYCTGGIRCEKSTAYLLQQGFTRVYQLDGGVLNYLSAVAPDESRWRGECFVFDDRVSVTERLLPGGYMQCHVCRHPLTDDDRCDARYRLGVSCSYCYAETKSTRPLPT